MRIAIVHYHLRRGGVTRVIENTVSGLLEKGVEVVVLASDASGFPESLAHHVLRIPELGYQSGEARVSAEGLERQLRQGATEALGGNPDLWHVHNHHLAKNTSLTEVVTRLAAAGEALLLHIHDFPEDGRGANYQVLRNDLGEGPERALGKRLYPLGERIGYGLLNRRDFRAMERAGFSVDRLRWLPNPVALPGRNGGSSETPSRPGQRLILYPTRAIRRKNLGEFLLWASLAAPGEIYGCTLAPDNPMARPYYDRWVERAKAWRLPVVFELGLQKGASFEALIESSDQVMTTSVAEGFGLAFLEPWLFGKPLTGRDLPDITDDFVGNGLDLSSLYEALWVPLSWIEEARWKEAFRSAVALSYQRYSLPLPEELLGEGLSGVSKEGRIDFGRLSEPFQESVIERLVRDPEASEALLPSQLPPRPGASVVSENRALAASRFGVSDYAGRLIEIYRSLVEAPVQEGGLEWGDPNRVLEQFLDPRTLSLLRT